MASQIWSLCKVTKRNGWHETVGEKAKEFVNGLQHEV